MAEALEDTSEISLLPIDRSHDLSKALQPSFKIFNEVFRKDSVAGIATQDVTVVPETLNDLR